MQYPKTKQLKRVKKDKAKSEYPPKPINALCACGCGLPAHDMHHAFIHRMKGYPELDVEENLVFVNHAQHISRAFDNQEWRIKFWKYQCDKYGEAHMYTWLASLSSKLQIRKDEMRRLVERLP
jgi:hypothetical protein